MCQELYCQQAVRSESRPDDKQIAESLSQMGLVQCGRYEFGNDFLFVTDVGQDGDNVLVDDDGAIRFIDPIVGFKTPLLPRLKDALESEEGVVALVNDLYYIENCVDRVEGAEPRNTLKCRMTNDSALTTTH